MLWMEKNLHSYRYVNIGMHKLIHDVGHPNGYAPTLGI